VALPRIIKTAGIPSHGNDASPAAAVMARLLRADLRPWADRALCGQTDPEIFFPDSDTQASEARAICARCQVRSQCLSYAMDAGENHGIWGGLDPQERQRLRRRKIAARPDTRGAA